MGASASVPAPYSAIRGFLTLMVVLGTVVLGVLFTGVPAAMYAASTLPQAEPGTEGPGDGFVVGAAMLLGAVPGALLGLFPGLWAGRRIRRIP